MAEYGLGNFVYELTLDGNNANFAFRDPEDISNVAEVSVPQSDFPDGIKAPDSRQVADLAYAQVSKLLNEKRDARLKKEAEQAVTDQQDKEAHEREVANDFFNKSQELASSETTGTVPAVEEDQLAPPHTPTQRAKDAKNSPAPDDGSEKKNKKKK